MINFDRRALADIDDEARRQGPTAPEDLETPAFTDVHSAGWRFGINEVRTDSEAMIMEEPLLDSIEAIRRHDPDLGREFDIQYQTKGAAPSFEMNRQRMQQYEQRVAELRERTGDPAIRPYSEILAETAEKTKADRKLFERTAANARGWAKLGLLTGPGAAVMTDPAILASMIFGAGEITGGSVAMNAWRAFRTEALIAGAVETGIQPGVFHWKKAINSPYTMEEAATNVVLAMVSAGALRATGSAVIDVATLRKAAKIKRAEGGARADQEADILDRHADDLEQSGAEKAVDDALEAERRKAEHFNKVDRAVEDLQAGRTADVGGNYHLEEVDPRTILVDAEQFQFKSGGDKEGVTGRLADVEQWDPVKAGVSIIYENAQGDRFIVDGHQRVALARRMIERGQPADEVKLNAFILRETDGVTPADARQVAALKNIAEGTGTALDTAKVFRELGEAGLDLMPALPKTGAMVRAGRGLAQLDDEAFQMAVNGVIDERYAAIVGELVEDAAEQRAIIGALAEADPSNLDQARIMIRDMKAAGFEKVETEDLFGGQVVAESLFKERARVQEAAVKRLRQDKTTFKTLEKRADTIADEGNVLNRSANAARISEDEKTLAALQRLANTVGPVSDALNDAARRLKGGERLGTVTEEFSGPFDPPMLQRIALGLELAELDARHKAETAKR